MSPDKGIGFLFMDNNHFLDCETQEVPAFKRYMSLNKQAEYNIKRIRTILEFLIFFSILLSVLLMGIVGCLLFIVWRLFAW